MPTATAASTADQLRALDAAPIIVASHPRSGTHLTIDLLRRQFGSCDAAKQFGERNDRVYLPLDGLRPERDTLSDQTALDIIRRVPRPIVKTHLLPGYREFTGKSRVWVDWLRDRAQIIYVYRDGRDVMCSLQHAAHNWAPNETLSITPYIQQSRHGMSVAKYWAEHVRQWMDRPNVLAIEYKQIIKSPRETLEKIGRFLGMAPRMREPYLPPVIKSAWHSRLIRLMYRHPPSTALVPGKVFRSRAPKWREAFDEQTCQVFQQEAGDMLVQLGFESDDTWTSRQRQPQIHVADGKQLLDRMAGASQPASN